MPVKEKSHYSRRVPVSVEDWQMKPCMPEKDKTTEERNIVFPVFVTFTTCSGLPHDVLHVHI